MLTLDLFENHQVREKKSSDQHYQDVAVQRAMRRAAAEFPTTASDAEAFAKSMLDQQEKDQHDIDNLRAGLRRQRDQLDKKDELDADQSHTIDKIRQEILKVDQENDDLESMLVKMQSANARLQKTLDTMRGRRPMDGTRP